MAFFDDCVFLFTCELVLICSTYLFCRSRVAGGGCLWRFMLVVLCIMSVCLGHEVQGFMSVSRWMLVVYVL